MRIVGKTDAGRVRKTNQDDLAYGLLPQGWAWSVVCDGMGGANGGSVASATAVKIISETIKKGCVEGTDAAGIKKLLYKALTDANTEVFNMARSEPSLLGMGTTVVACIADSDTAYFAHAGDSRAYLVSNGHLIQMTKDHSIVQEMLESGKLTPEQARNHPQKNIITRALGVEETLDIDFCETTFAKGSSVVICTDGLTNHVSEETAAKVLAESGEEESTVRLVELALENGGSDNITVVVISNDRE